MQAKTLGLPVLSLLHILPIPQKCKGLQDLAQLCKPIFLVINQSINNMNRTNTKPLICNKENHVIWKLLQNAPGDQIFFPLSYQPRISFKLLLLTPTKYQQNAETQTQSPTDVFYLKNWTNRMLFALKFSYKCWKQSCDCCIVLSRARIAFGLRSVRDAAHCSSMALHSRDGI